MFGNRVSRVTIVLRLREVRRGEGWCDRQRGWGVHGFRLHRGGGACCLGGGSGSGCRHIQLLVFGRVVVGECVLVASARGAAKGGRLLDAIQLGIEEVELVVVLLGASPWSSPLTLDIRECFVY